MHIADDKYKDSVHISPEDYKEIGHNMLLMRKRAKYSRKEAADELGIVEDTIKKKEQGHNITLDDIMAICKIYNCRLDEIMPRAFMPYVSKKGSILALIPTAVLRALSEILMKELERRKIA